MGPTAHPLTLIHPSVRNRCSANFALKLSEKEVERSCERGFGPYNRPEIGQRCRLVPRKATFRAPPGLFRQFHNGVLGSSLNSELRTTTAPGVFAEFLAADT